MIMNKSKSLLRAILFVCFSTCFAAYSQKSEIFIQVDPLRKEIVTHVTLKELPLGVDIVWQQHLPQEAHIASAASGNQNADSKLLMMNFSRHMIRPTMSFSFLCKMDTIKEWILWGESSITYTKDAQEKIVRFPAKVFIVSNCLIYPSDDVEMKQETANYMDGDGASSNVIVVTATEKANEKQIPIAETKANIDEVKQKLDKEIERIRQEEATISASIPPPESVVDKKIEAVAKAEEKVVEVKSTEIKESQIVENKIEESKVATTINPQAAQKAAPAYESGFYIQVSAVKSKRNLTEIKDYVHLLKDDDLIEVKKEKYYIYLIGPFPTRQDANDKREYYKKYVSDAYVIKM